MELLRMLMPSDCRTSRQPNAAEYAKNANRQQNGSHIKY